MKFNVGDAPIEGRGDFPKLELSTNEVARVNILTTKGWEVTVRHWVDRMGYVHCHAIHSIKEDTPEAVLTELFKIQEEGGRPDECLLCKMAVEGRTQVKYPNRRFALWLLRYKTNQAGDISPGALKYWLEIWIIDNRKYRQLQGIIAEWGGKEKRLNRHDLTLTCTEGKYQQIDIDVKKDALWVKEKDEVKKYFAEEIQKYDLMDCLGASLDKEALTRRFAVIERRTAREAPVELESEKDVLQETVKPGEEAAAEVEGDEFDFEKPFEEKETVQVESEKETPEADFLDDILKDVN